MRVFFVSILPTRTLEVEVLGGQQHPLLVGEGLELPSITIYKMNLFIFLPFLLVKSCSDAYVLPL